MTRSLGMFCAAIVALVGRSAGAQAVRGGFEDATLPLKGEVRLGIGAAFDGTKDTFGRAGASGNARTPLGAALSFDSLGAAQLPAIARTQGLLRDSLGVPLGITLGSVTTNVRTLVTRVPLQAELGITRRLSLGVTVPLVRTRQAVSLRVNRGGGSANLGFNPASTAFSSGTAAAASQQNAALQTQLANASHKLDSLVTNCSTTATTLTAACTAVLANRTAAAQLVREARTIANGLAQVYGTATRPGTAFVPVAGSDAERAVEARLRSLGTRFGSFQVSDLTATANPAAATALISEAGFQTIVTNPAFGIGADSIGPAQRAGIGDVEAAANLLWLDTFGETADRGAPGLRVRSVVGAGYRFATGGIDLPFNLFDVPTGSGAALLLRSATDVSLGRRFWGTFAVHVDQPMSATYRVRVPDAAGTLLVPLSHEQDVDRKLGRLVSIELTPRWVPTSSFGVSAHYAMQSRQADQYTGTFTVVDSTQSTAQQTLDASVLNAGTGGRAQVLGFGATYSTLAANARGATWLPMEVSYLHTRTVAGSGGVVPATTSDQVLVRVYWQLLGRSRRR